MGGDGQIAPPTRRGQSAHHGAVGVCGVGTAQDGGMAQLRFFGAIYRCCGSCFGCAVRWWRRSAGPGGGLLVHCCAIHCQITRQSRLSGAGTAACGLDSVL